jgi:hypothetical protein
MALKYRTYTQEQKSNQLVLLIKDAIRHKKFDGQPLNLKAMRRYAIAFF